MELDILRARFLSLPLGHYLEKKNIGVCHIDYSKWCTLAADRVAPSTKASPLQTFRRKDAGERTAKLQRQTLIDSSAAAATGPARHALGSPAQTRLRSMWTTFIVSVSKTVPYTTYLAQAH